MAAAAAAAAATEDQAQVSQGLMVTRAGWTLAGGQSYGTGTSLSQRGLASQLVDSLRVRVRV